MNKFLYPAIALISIAAGAAGFSYLSTTLPLPDYALYYQEPREIQPFSFIDEKNEAFTASQLTAKWSIVFLGYTSCPDVCPTTLQNLHFIYDELTTIAENSQVIFVSADPKRDNIEKLSQYINYFNKDFKALRAEHDVLFPFSRNLGLMYAINSTDNDDKNYGVDHSASLILINPNGKVAAIFKPEHKVGEVPVINNEKLLSDFKKIVALF
jgi:protein SCO1/2